MGATGIGPTAQLDIGTGGTIGAAVANMTGKGAETAILFGVPVAVVPVKTLGTDCTVKVASPLQQIGTVLVNATFT